MVSMTEEMMAEILKGVKDCREAFIPQAIETCRELISEQGMDQAILRMFVSSAHELQPQDLVFIITAALLVIAESDYNDNTTNT